MSTKADIQKELVRSRGFIRAALTQIEKTEAVLAELEDEVPATLNPAPAAPQSAQITSIVPNTGDSGGGETIRINLTRVREGDTVTIGGTLVSVLGGQYGLDGYLDVSTPSGSPGFVDVVVNSYHGTATASGGFEFYGEGNPEPPATLIWDDDFETDRLSSYFEYLNGGGSFLRTAGAGESGGYGMVCNWSPGQTEGGNLKLAFGRTPDSYMAPVDAGDTDYRDIYCRIRFKVSANWTPSDANKFCRGVVFAAQNWSEAAICHVWNGSGTQNNRLIFDPASGTDTSGALKTTGYNDWDNLRWIGQSLADVNLFSGAARNVWHTVQWRWFLGDPGESNGGFQMWINGNLAVNRTGMNWCGSFDDYGINAIFFENFINGGAPGAQSMILDRITVSTAYIEEGPPPALVAPTGLNLSAATQNTVTWSVDPYPVPAETSRVYYAAGTDPTTDSPYQEYAPASITGQVTGLSAATNYHFKVAFTRGGEVGPLSSMQEITTAGSGTSLSAGTITLTPSATSVGLSATAATGGTGTKTYQWRRRLYEYPAVPSSANTTGTSLSGGVSLNLPSGVQPGDLLVIVAANDSTGGTSLSVSGATQIRFTQYSGNTVSHGVWARIATGSDSMTLTGASQDYAAIVVRVTNHGVTTIATDILSATPATANSSNPNPPNLNAGSTRKWLWLTTFGSDDDDNAANYAPAQFTAIAQAESAQSTTSCMTGAAYRHYEGSSLDPGTFTMSASEEWIANTIAIPPKPAEMQNLSGKTGLSETDTGLTTGVQQTYDLVATDQAAASVIYDSKSATPTDTTPPSVPTGLAAGTPTQTSIPLTWNAHPDTDGDLSEIRVYYNQTNSAVTTANNYASFQPNATSGYLVGLTASTLTRFAIAARDDWGNQSALSSEVSATTANPPVGAQPYVVEEFTYSSTSDMLADPRGIYLPGESIGTDRISLDQSVLFNGHPTMRYDWPTNANEPTITRSMKVPNGTNKIWVEAWVRFPSNYIQGVQGKKVMHLAVVPDTLARFGLSMENASTLNFEGPVDNYDAWHTVGPQLSGVLDNQWHQIRMHADVSGSNPKYAEWWLDGVRRMAKSANTGVTGIWTVFLGKNFNHTPSIPVSEWWGEVRIWTTDPGW